MSIFNSKTILVAALAVVSAPAMATSSGGEFGNVQVISAKVDVATGNMTIIGSVDCAFDESSDYVRLNLTANQHWGNSNPASNGYHNAYNSAVDIAAPSCDFTTTPTTAAWSVTIASTDKDKFKTGTAVTITATAEEFDEFAQEEGESETSGPVVIKARNLNSN